MLLLLVVVVVALRADTSLVFFCRRCCARTQDYTLRKEDKARYKAYVALHERRIVGESAISDSSSSSSKGKDLAEQKKPESESKPLLKRLFFWR